MTMKKLSRLLALSLLLLASLAQAGDTVTYFVPDHTGSPVAAMDARGNVLWREAHGPWGERLLRDARNSATPSYTGKPEDRDTGLVYMGARWYDPAAGRFTGIDPVGFGADNVQTFNRYAYANNSPYRYVDPDGETPVDIIFLAYDAAGFAAAVYSGNSMAMWESGADLTASFLGVVSPVPGTGQAIKAARAAEAVTDGIGAAARARAVGIAARAAPVSSTQAGERFVRVGHTPENLKFSFDAPGGTLPGTYAFPEETFKAVGHDPARLKDLGDLPGPAPQYYRILEPPEGTPIQRGVVPGGEFGGRGGVPEVIFPEGF